MAASSGIVTSWSTKPGRSPSGAAVVVLAAAVEAAVLAVAGGAAEEVGAANTAAGSGPGEAEPFPGFFLMV